MIFKKWGAMPPLCAPPVRGGGAPPGKKILTMTLSSIWAFRIYIVLSWYIYTDRVYWGQRISRKWGAPPPWKRPPPPEILFCVKTLAKTWRFQIYIVWTKNISIEGEKWGKTTFPGGAMPPFHWTPLEIFFRLKYSVECPLSENIFCY